MTCRSCGNESAYHVTTRYATGDILDACEQCGAGSVPTAVDAYFDRPGAHYGLYDASGSPIYVESKSHKAHVMKSLNVQEAGDRRHGAISYDPVYSRIARQNFENSLRRKP